MIAYFRTLFWVSLVVVIFAMLIGAAFVGLVHLAIMAPFCGACAAAVAVLLVVLVTMPGGAR